VNPQQVIGAARQAARARHTTVSSTTSTDKLSVTFRVGEHTLRSPRSKYPWDEWLDGNVHYVDVSDGGPFPSPEAIRVACHAAAKRERLRVHAIAVAGGNELMIWAERPGSSIGSMPWDEWFDGQPHTIPTGPGRPWGWLPKASLVGLLSGEARRRRTKVRLRTGTNTITLTPRVPGRS